MVAVSAAGAERDLIPLPSWYWHLCTDWCRCNARMEDVLFRALVLSNLVLLKIWNKISAKYSHLQHTYNVWQSCYEKISGGWGSLALRTYCSLGVCIRVKYGVILLSLHNVPNHKYSCLFSRSSLLVSFVGACAKIWNLILLYSWFSCFMWFITGLLFRCSNTLLKKHLAM